MVEIKAVTAVVLAGGRGTRIKEFYPDLPKPLIPVDGLPFLYYVTEHLVRHGLAHILYSTGYCGDQIEAWRQSVDWPGVKLECIMEQEPLGTGGGVLLALDHCSPWILIVNGDSLCLKGLTELLAITSSGYCGGIIGLQVVDTSRYGTLVSDAAGNLCAFQEKRPGAGVINAGLVLIRRAALEALNLPVRCSLETDVMCQLIDSGCDIRIISVADSPFIDIGTPETLQKAEQFIRDHFSYVGTGIQQK